MSTKLSAKQYEMLEYADVRGGLLAPHADRPALHILTDTGRAALAQKRNNTDEDRP